MSTRAQIMTAFATRLAKVTTANGYSTNVRKVFFDKIPMGLQMQDYELPAIFLLDKFDNLQLQIDRVEGRWEFALQLWHTGKQTDATMHEFVADIMKTIYADSPTIQTHGAFRAIHNQIVEVIPLSVTGDLQMIDANRIYELRFVIVYRTKLYTM